MKQKFRFAAIGTEWSIDTEKELSDELRQTVTKRIAEFDEIYSRFRDDSMVAKLRSPGTYDFPATAHNLMAFYRLLYEVTDGAVTPLVGGILEQAGYDSSYSLRRQKVMGAIPIWDEVMLWHGRRVEVKQPIVLDVGAAGKGYMVDLVAEILKQHGVYDYVIDASGDIRHHGSQPERVGLENPYDPSRVLGAVDLRNASLCASASNRRKWGEWHHIIDGRTGKPARNVVASWVIAETTMVADGLATALFFVPPERLKRWHFQAVRLLADGHIEKTPNFVGQLFV